jgi:septal ring factor EnvC (AmiA/AmiB activator)
MLRTSRFLRLLTAASLIAAFGMSGCTKKPSQEEVSKLETARGAAESAEKKLSELRQERMQLEQQLEQKKQELKKAEDERDELKAKAGTPPPSATPAK